MSNREKVIKGLEICTNIMPDSCSMLCPYKDETDGTYSGFCEQVLLQDALVMLKEQPEIVRCKDCKHGCGRGRGMYCQFIECEKTGAFHKEDWFCFDGGRQ